MTEEERVERVGVVGCGLMGGGISEVVARAGLEVVVVESSPQTVAAGQDRLAASLQRAHARGKVADVGEVLDRITLTTDFEALADRELVIEAVLEDEHAKTEVFRRLDRTVTAPDALLASNTSSIPLTRLGVATDRPEQVLGVHFFNPVPVLPLVELVPGLRTAPASLERARVFVEERLGKQTIQSPDRAGFVVNALLVPFVLSAIRMLESGFATAEDIDRGLVLGAAHPQGPLALADLIGLDTLHAIAESLHAEYKETHLASPPLLARMVDAGLLGRKTGRGFFTY